MKPLHARRYDELTFPMTHDCHCVGDPKDWTFREKVWESSKVLVTYGLGVALAQLHPDTWPSRSDP